RGDARGAREVECPERKVHEVAAEIGEYAAAEFPPVTPVIMRPRFWRLGVLRFEEGIARGPQPQVDVELRRGFRAELLSRRGLAVHPDMHSLHRPEQPGSHDLHGAAIIVPGVN